MSNGISGNVTGKIVFNVDKKSWQNLNLFQKKMTAVKRQMSGLKGSIKVNAVVQDIRKVTSAVSRGSDKIHNAQIVSYQRYQKKLNDARKAAQRKAKLGSSGGDVSHLFGSQGAGMSASGSALADMLRKEEQQAHRARQNVYAAEWKAAEKERKLQQRIERSKDTAARKSVAAAEAREKHIQHRMAGMQHSYSMRLGGGKGYELAMKQSQASIGNAVQQYRSGAMTMKQFNQAVSQTTQTQIRQGIVNRQNAVSFRTLRHDLIQATAAYTAFSVAANVFNTGKEFDSLKASMSLFAKDDAGVAETMKYIRGESERLGINFEEAAKGFTKFSIVARNKMSKEQSREFFSGFSEYATVLQVDQHRFQRGIMAVQQMLSKAKVTSEELKNQLAENIPGSIEIFADAMGISEKEMFKQMDQGKILAQDVLPKVAKQYAKVARENGALGKATEKVNSHYQRFLSALTQAKVDFFEGGFGQQMAEVFKIMSQFLKTTDFRAMGALFGGMIRGMTEALNILLLPLKSMLNLFGLIFGEDGAKWAGYILGVSLLAGKVIMLANALGKLLVVARLLKATPVGLAMTGLAIAGGYAMDKYMFNTPTVQPNSKPANIIAQQHSYNTNSQQSINVAVIPDSGEFSKAVTAKIVGYKQDSKADMASQLV